MTTTTKLRIHRGYKTELKLNKSQQILCRKHAGCARFAYNWGLQGKSMNIQKLGRYPPL
ncbi:MAG: helix-turn-helix domain-containing protein [Promethearchaeota archaeon]